jgi:MOSC domain-containing protein YiiM
VRGESKRIAAASNRELLQRQITMKILSINVALPRTVLWKGMEVTTGIFKEPVRGPVMMRQLDLDGDEQADLSVHGGPNKAVYAYPSEHYSFWKKEFPEMDLPWGMFGENLTTEGLTEKDANIGDHYRLGQAVVMVTQPRLPCFKLGLKFGRDDILKRFMESGRSGFYFSVLEEGVVEAGNTIEKIHQDKNKISVADINHLYVHGGEGSPLLRRAVRVEALPEGMRNYLRKQLHSIERRTHTEIK